MDKSLDVSTVCEERSDMSLSPDVEIDKKNSQESVDSPISNTQSNTKTCMKEWNVMHILKEEMSCMTIWTPTIRM